MGTLLGLLLLQAPTQEEVEAAVRKGVGAVRHQKGELVLWTLLYSGVPETDPDVRRLFDDMLKEPPGSTTSAALQAMILEDWDRVKFQARIAHCAQQLIDTQCADGFWNEGRAVEAPDLVLPPKVRAKHKLVQRATGNEKGSPELGRWALWGLRAAHDSGVVPPAEVVEKAARAWRGGAHDAGDTVSALSICDYISGRKWRKNPDVLKALEGLKAEKRTDPKGLYGRKIAIHHFGDDVSAADVKALLAAQRPDGSWGDVEATCYATMALYFPRRP